MKKQAIMWLVAVMVAVLVVGCGQKNGWQEKRIEVDGREVIGYFIKSEEVIQNDTLNGRVFLTAGISPKNDTTYSIFFPSKSPQFSFQEALVVDDYVVINNKKYWGLMSIETSDAVPELGLPCGYNLGLDRAIPNLLTIPRIEVSYYHNNTPIKMTFTAE